MNVLSRKVVGCAALAVALACAAVASTPSLGSAASSSASLTFNVASATTLVPGGCATGVAGITDFGVVLPATKVVTSADCTITSRACPPARSTAACRCASECSSARRSGQAGSSRR